MNIQEIAQKGLQKDTYNKYEVLDMVAQYTSLIFRMDELMTKQGELLKRAIK